jgi:hypothetical protein
MKKRIFYYLAASILFLFIGNQPASAQTREFSTTFQVPFDFQVGAKVLPAGTYIVKRDQQRPQILMMNCPERKLWMTFQTIPHSLSEELSISSLTFKKYGEKHFLSEVKILGRENGYALLRSKAERRLSHAAKEEIVHASGPSGASGASGASRAIPNGTTMVD